MEQKTERHGVRKSMTVWVIIAFNAFMVSFGYAYYLDSRPSAIHFVVTVMILGTYILYRLLRYSSVYRLVKPMVHHT